MIRRVDRLRERGYPAGELTAELEKVDRVERVDLLGRVDKARGEREEGRVPMMVTFGNFLPDLRAIIRKIVITWKKTSR